MIKHLLLSIAALGGIGSAGAETMYYTTDFLGNNVAVSPNGRFVVIADVDDTRSYIWDAENPEEFVPVQAPNDDRIELYGITNDGMAVGAYYAMGGVFNPCIVVNGVVKDLPNSPMAMNTNAAKCVTADGKIIGGNIAYKDPDSEVGLRYRPCFWRLNEEGEYDLDLDPSVELPEHQGFIVNCMNPEGTVLGGRLYCGAGSEIPAIFKDGRMIYWNELETVMEPFYYKGDLLGYFEAYYIDGMKDGCKGEYLMGEFSGSDAWGNFYGCRTNVDWVSEDGEDYQLSHSAIVYNIASDEMVDYPAAGGISTFSTGVGQNREYIFCNGDRMLVGNEGEEEVKSVSGTFDFTNVTAMTAVMSASADGRVIAGTRQELHPATQEYLYYPFIVVLDQPLVDGPVTGVEVIAGEKGNAIVVSNGRIDFAGGEGMVFDLDGRQVGRGSSVNVASGIYVVKAGDVTRKVMVK